MAAQRRGLAKPQLAEQVRWQLSDRVVPHLCADKLEEQLGSKTDLTAQGSSMGK